MRQPPPLPDSAAERPSRRLAIGLTLIVTIALVCLFLALMQAPQQRGGGAALSDSSKSDPPIGDASGRESVHDDSDSPDSAPEGGSSFSEQRSDSTGHQDAPNPNARSKTPEDDDISGASSSEEELSGQPLDDSPQLQQEPRSVAPSGQFFVRSEQSDDDEKRPTPRRVKRTAPQVEGLLSGRSRADRTLLLDEFGGSDVTEHAVKLALDWLARNQLESGEWSLSGPYSGGASAENRAAATSLALLAFQGAGHTHEGDREAPYRQTVRQGWIALRDMQDRQGQFGNLSTQGGMYGQALCTIAACELYGMTNDRDVRRVARRAVQFAEDAQSPMGGWRYRPRSDSDTSVTGWFVMGLQSARMAGLEVSRETLSNVSGYLDNAASHSRSRYSYQPGTIATRSMTAEALLCRQYEGWLRTDPALTAGAEYILQELPGDSSSRRDVYTWYYATQVLHNIGGAPWEQWNESMQNTLTQSQVAEGPEVGSWAPDGDRYGGTGGRLYVTCLSVLMLEVYYRHLPLYDLDSVR